MQSWEITNLHVFLASYVCVSFVFVPDDIAVQISTEVQKSRVGSNQLEILKRSSFEEVSEEIPHSCFLMRSLRWEGT